jgi:hypothetical protein
MTGSFNERPPFLFFAPQAQEGVFSHRDAKRGTGRQDRGAQAGTAGAQTDTDTNTSMQEPPPQHLHRGALVPNVRGTGPAWGLPVLPGLPATTASERVRMVESPKRAPAGTPPLGASLPSSGTAVRSLARTEPRAARCDVLGALQPRPSARGAIRVLSLCVPFSLCVLPPPAAAAAAAQRTDGHKLGTAARTRREALAVADSEGRGPVNCATQLCSALPSELAAGGPLPPPCGGRSTCIGSTHVARPPHCAQSNRRHQPNHAQRHIPALCLTPTAPSLADGRSLPPPLPFNLCNDSFTQNHWPQARAISHASSKETPRVTCDAQYTATASLP